MKKVLFISISLIIVLALVLVGCTESANTPGATTTSQAKQAVSEKDLPVDKNGAVLWEEYYPKLQEKLLAM